MHREAVGQIDIGGREVHPRQHPVAVAQHVLPQDRDPPGGGQQQAEQHGDGRRLAGAVAPEQRHRRPGRHAEIDAVHGDDLTVVLDKSGDLDDRLRHGRDMGCGPLRHSHAGDGRGRP